MSMRAKTLSHFSTLLSQLPERCLAHSKYSREVWGMNELISTGPIVIQFSESMPNSMYFRRKGKKKSKWNGMFLPLTPLLIWVTEFITSLDPNPAMDSLAKSPAHLGGRSNHFSACYWEPVNLPACLRCTNHSMLLGKETLSSIVSSRKAHHSFHSPQFAQHLNRLTEACSEYVLSEYCLWSFLALEKVI